MMMMKILENSQDRHRKNEEKHDREQKHRNKLNKLFILSLFRSFILIPWISSVLLRPQCPLLPLHPLTPYKLITKRFD